MKLFLAATHVSADITKKWKPLYVLESFQYIRSWQIDERRNWKGFMLDSGAFTFLTIAKRQNVSIDWDKYLDSYIRFINENQVEHFFELDIDKIVGYAAVKQMRKRLERRTGRQCIPVWHRSRGLEEFRNLCAEYDYVAIGGLAIKDIKPTEYGYIKKLVSLAASYGTKIHGLGYSKPDLLDYGFYSTDSASWSVNVAYGNVYRFNGERMISIRPPKGMMGANYYKRRDTSMREWVKYQRYLDTKG